MQNALCRLYYGMCISYEWEWIIWQHSLTGLCNYAKNPSTMAGRFCLAVLITTSYVDCWMHVCTSAQMHRCTCMCTRVHTHTYIHMHPLSVGVWENGMWETVLYQSVNDVMTYMYRQWNLPVCDLWRWKQVSVSHSKRWLFRSSEVVLMERFKLMQLNGSFIALLSFCIMIHNVNVRW